VIARIGTALTNSIAKGRNAMEIFFFWSFFEKYADYVKTKALLEMAEYFKVLGNIKTRSHKAF
jgi:hypothetical protein